MKSSTQIASLAILLFVWPSRDVPAREFPSPPPFLGETLRYTMSVMGVTGGELTLSARTAELAGRPVYKLELSALSNEFLSRLFLVRDYMASWVDPRSLRSLRFEKHTVEGKRVRDDLIEFFYDQKIAERDGKPIAIVDPAFDALSSVYYIRTLDLSSGETVELNVVSRKLFTLRVVVKGKETVVTPAGTFRTIRVEPQSSGESGLIGKGRNLILWLTDDERRIPVQLRSKLKVGTLVGKLQAIETQPERSGELSTPTRPWIDGGPSALPVGSARRPNLVWVNFLAVLPYDRFLPWR